jgi:AcrR family transcriptional regulator
MDENKATRRRGAALENAILDAAWSEISEHGYPGLTLKAVAQRAGTSRPVLSRRWSTHARLATAALARHIALHSVVVPDLGSVRDEMIFLLRAMAERARPNMLRLFFDLREDLVEEQSNFAELRSRVVGTDLVEGILRRGVARGEIDPTRLTPRIAALPTDLAHHEIMMKFAPPVRGRHPRNRGRDIPSPCRPGRSERRRLK